MSNSKPIGEVLAFDWGTDIVGVLDVCTGLYSSYRGRRMSDGARRVFDCAGTIVSYNGARCDLQKLAELLSRNEEYVKPKGRHVDMLVEASKDRWPPNPGTSPILGTDLRNQYRYFFGEQVPELPGDITDEYEQDNCRDCQMTAELWKRLCGNPDGNID